MKQTKAQSQVISAVLLILIILSAVVIVWNLTQGLVKSNLEEADININQVQLNVDPASIYVDKDSGKMQFSISRESDKANLSVIRIIINGNESKTYIIKEPLNQRALESYVLSLGNLSNIKSISVYPVSQNNQFGLETKIEIKETFFRIPAQWYKEPIYSEEESESESEEELEQEPENCEGPTCICSDGTLYGQCSSTRPKYCDNGTLIDNCPICGGEQTISMAAPPEPIPEGWEQEIIYQYC